MSAEILVAVVGVMALALYAIFGGADFGGGVWDALASGPRRDEQRTVISHAIGPVWEANHVWLIFVIVLLFTCFPPAFAALSIGLYFPLTFALVGIILRGAAFAFRSQARNLPGASQFWGRVFGIASVITPFFFGTAAGGLAVGHFAWTSPFALAVGLFAVAMCAQIAAVFLTMECEGRLRDDFRSRSIAATFALAAVGAGALLVARITAPATFAELSRPQAVPSIAAAMLLGLVVLGTLFGHRYAAARIAVAAEALAVLIGWYAAQTPYLIPGVMRYDEVAAPRETLAAFLWLVLFGSVLLVPSLALLFRVFKTDVPRQPERHEGSGSAAPET